MPGADGLRFAGLDQTIARVLPDRFEQVIPRHSRSLLDVYERTIHESGETVEHAFLHYVGIHAHAFRRVELKTAGEHREPAQYNPLVVGQQSKTPVHRRAKRPMPGKGRAHPSREQTEPIFQAGQDLIGRQHPHPGRCQLDRERDAVQTDAYRSNGTRIFLGDSEILLHLRRAIPKQPHRLARGHLRSRCLFGGKAQRWHAPCDLTVHTERLAARRQTRQGGTGIEKLVNERGAVGNHVLAVVEQQKSRALTQAAGNDIEKPFPLNLLDRQRRSDDVWQE